MIKAREEVQNLSLRLNANRGLRGLRLPYHIDRSQRVGGGHVWPCPLDSLNGKHGLAHMVLTGCQGIPKSLSDDVLKVRVHVGMRAQPAAKEKPRRSGASARPPGYGHPRAARASRLKERAGWSLPKPRQNRQ